MASKLQEVERQCESEKRRDEGGGWRGKAGC